ncbi:MAG: glutamate synthase large subunit [Gemmatimonadetes bacterium]|nr:glutamate synthase large subunit [Gemmatimonadota bacterium]
MPRRAPPVEHRDACGVGFVAARDAAPSHRLVRVAVECLRRLDHRGAKSADGSGDGAGLMTRIPYRLLAPELARQGRESAVPGRLGVLMVFLPPQRPQPLRAAIARALAEQDLTLLTWRRVPVSPAVLGGWARATMPRIEQALVTPGPAVPDEDEFERRLLLARKAVAREEGAEQAAAVVSSSCRTVVYKGMFTAAHLADFYADLRDPAYASDFAVFHQRYSTNTFPTWSLAQPFRLLAHNGEINTIRANRAWMAAREADATAEVWGPRTVDLRPFLGPDRSDSAGLDNAFELLVRSGRSLSHAKEMLIPGAWENVADLEPSLRAFYEYHAFLTEPWDGPAAIAAGDGVEVLAGVDRNGLRPARWMVNPDLVLVASEAGVAPEEEARAVANGQLGPGESLAVDLATGEVRHSVELKRSLAARRPYGEWISLETLYVADPFDDLQDYRFDPVRLARVFGYTAEERRLILAEMAQGRVPTGSMGNDTPLAALSQPVPRLTRFFHQMFAQVTNPPIDPIRERLVMSLRTYLGRRGSLLAETREQAHLVQLASPVISDAELSRLIDSPDPAFRSVVLPALFPAAGGPEALRPALEALCTAAVAAVAEGATILVLTDREVDAASAPIPMLLAVGAVHHRLIDGGLRLHASIVVASGCPRDDHDLACLVAYGASAVNPYLAIEEVRAMAAAGEIPIGVQAAQEAYRRQLEEGLLKILSKMGIGTVSAYRGSELFEVVGLDAEVTDLAFRHTPRRVGGFGLEHLAAAALARHERYDRGEEEPGGYYRHRRGGPPHVLAPGPVLALHQAVRAGGEEEWEAYLTRLGRRTPAQLRDLMTFATRRPVPLEEVEPEEHIMRRFTSAAMSLGALSREAHEALAEAMSFLGGMANSGEGGQDPGRFATPRDTAIKQVASGRFGVTPWYLASAEELQIKMAQGSKPGEGGQLPGRKVSAEIARVRGTRPGTTLISPPPHHDIYSIEDLAQLVSDLRTFRPGVRVSVKLASEPGVGVIAVGVAKAQADGVVISGHEGGTGASPLTSIKHAGSPWEVGLAEAHQTLVESGIRDRVVLEVEGGLRTGRDVVVAALLGAERFGFGTLPMLALGCKMIRRCHQDCCPTGIATQREDLRANFAGRPDDVVTLFRLLAGEVRSHLAALGARSIEEIVGRSDLLRPADSGHPVARALDDLLVPFPGRSASRRFEAPPPSPLGESLAEEAMAGWAAGTPVRLARSIDNTDRAVGTRLAGLIAARYPAGLPEGSVDIHLTGTAGQSLGAFLVPGVTLRLDGPANDGVGKGMGGGCLAIIPPALAGGGPVHAAGNAVLYGATGGSLFVAGTVGLRFAVRNSGARAVVEGCLEHGAEYMTGGAVAILGRTGRNLAAGMTGGVLFVWDPDGDAPHHFATTAPQAARPAETDLVELRELLEAHLAATGSEVARGILGDWEAAGPRFWVLRASPR